MAHEVFISYSRNDKRVADAVCSTLESHGVSCWIAPRNVPKGMEWAAVLPSAIKAASVMVLVFSSSANSSVPVRREVRIVSDNHKVIIPYRIEDVEATGAMEYYLPDLQFLDALTPDAAGHLSMLAAETLANLPPRPNPEGQAPPVPVASPALEKPKEPLTLPATKINPKDGAEMILIPAGEFLMGDDDQGDNPRRTVTLPDYYLYKNLVTVGQYEKFCKETKREMPSAPDFNSGWSKKDHPIVYVSWEDADTYCDWAGVKLPTETQWEKAARGTAGWKYPWGNDWDGSRCANSVEPNDLNGTMPVDSYPSGASPYGVLDVAGNVWQWCADWYDDKQDTRVLRGGSWYIDDPGIFRSADRGWYEPTDRGSGGFRCCASPGLP